MEQLRQIRRTDVPPALQLVLDAITTLLGCKPKQTGDPNRGLFAEQGLLQQLQVLVPHPASVSAARRFTTNPMCTPDAAGKTSTAGRLLCEWIRAVTSEFTGLLQSLKQLAATQAVSSQTSSDTRSLTVEVPNAAGSIGSVGSSTGQIQPSIDAQPEPHVPPGPHQQPIRPQREPQLQESLQPNTQSTASMQRLISGSVPPPLQQHISPSMQPASAHRITAATSAPARPAPNVALGEMDSSAVEAWLSRKGLAELFPKLRSKCMDHGVALSWISSQLRDPRAEVLSKCEDALKIELQVPLGVLYQFLYRVEHYVN